MNDISLSDLDDLIEPRTRDAILKSDLPPMQAWHEWVQQVSDDTMLDSYGLRPEIAVLLKLGATRRIRAEHPFDVISRYVIGHLHRDRERRRFKDSQPDEWITNEINGRSYPVYLSSVVIREDDEFVPAMPYDSSPSDQYIDLFHGTNEDSAMVICQEGISLDAGRVPADYGRGFYAGPWHVAFNRALAIATGLHDNVALLHWTVPKDNLQRLLPHIILPEPDSVWKQLTRYFRSLDQSRTQLDDISLDMPANLHYIHGPMVANATEVPGRDPVPVRLHDGRVPMQWAFHTEHCTKLLSKCRARIILYHLPAE